MAKSWKALKAELFTPEQLARIESETERMIEELALAELRAARELSQVQLAETLGVKQASISQMENQTDMYVGTLRRYIQAMGGSLEIIAHFPEGDVRINQFAELAATAPEKPKKTTNKGRPTGGKSTSSPRRTSQA